MKTSRYFWSYIAHFFLEWEMFQTEVVKEIKTYFVFNIFFWKLSILWDNVEKYCGSGQATGDNVVHAHYLLTYLLTHSLTPWSRVLLKKVTGFQLVKKFPAFYGTQRVITTFTSACNMSLSWARSIPSMPPHPTFWRSILILSSHLHLIFQVVSFHQVSPPKPTLHAG